MSSEASEKMMILLKELSLLKAEDEQTSVNDLLGEDRKQRERRRQEIATEIKNLGEQTSQ
jgi:hypothetical protein